ncbi:MAG: hypothetical protein AAF696_09300 [Bacteroidota bacterium]
MSKEKISRVQLRFEEALKSLAEKLEEDRNILALLVSGSLSYDVVWEKSDIDLMIIAKDGKLKQAQKNLTLTEWDVNIHVWIEERSAFRKLVEASLRSSFIHSYFSKSKLVYSKDASLYDLYKDVELLGSRDQQSQVLAQASFILPLIAKVEKFLYQKNDPRYAFIWFTYMYTGLAKICVNLAGEIAGREVIHQAMNHEADFFRKIYTELIDLPKTETALEEALIAVDRFLTERIDRIFKPLLDFLSFQARIKSATEIDSWAQQEWNIEGLIGACEWLADKEIIHRSSVPIRLTPSSLVEVEELAFYY